MGSIIIYATIMVNGMISAIEYKGTSFYNDAECIEFLDKNNTHINKTLADHLEKNEPNSVVLFIGCSERDKFYNSNEHST